MVNQIAIGIAAGLAAALLYGTVAAGTALSMVLFYMAALPLLIAGLGWGWASALVGAAIAAVAAFFMLGAKASLLFMLAVCAPAVWLAYLANLARRSGNGSGAVEWYPVGRLIAWVSVLGGLLLLPSVIAFDFSLAAYEASIRETFSRLLEGGGGASELPPDFDPEALAAFFVRFVPPVSVMVWIGMSLANLYVAGRIVQISGRLKRPWPDLTRLELPRALAGALAGALIASFLPGLPGVVAGSFAAGFLFAFMIQGLAVMHVVTRPSKVRPLILGGVYFVLVFLGWSGAVLSWSGLLLALLGLAEQVVALRSRVPGGGPGAGPGGRAILPPQNGRDHSNDNSDGNSNDDSNQNQRN